MTFAQINNDGIWMDKFDGVNEKPITKLHRN
jgi:hypothetical protein